MMKKVEWDGQELFNYDGRSVFIVQRYNPKGLMVIADFQTGVCEEISYRIFVILICGEWMYVSRLYGTAGS